MVTVEFFERDRRKIFIKVIKANKITGSYFDLRLTTRASTRLRTLSPISGEMSLPNCCSVVRKRLSLLSWRAPQVAGSCWLASDEEEEEDGPLL